MPAIALIILAVVAGSAWAAWGSTARQAGRWTAAATSTPTRTPRPVTPAATVAVLEPAIAAPTTTPSPLPAATAEPTAVAAVATAEPMPAWLADVARRYGIDGTRRFVVVSLDEQMMTVWDPGRPLRRMAVSTGDESRGYRTLPWYGLVGDYWGTFNSYGVYADEGWYLFEDAGTILVHSAPYKLVNGQKVYREMDALGAYPASKGCIRLAPEDATWFTEWQPKGVPLVILPKSQAGG